LSFIPSSVLRRLYQRQSLRNVHGGITLTLKNRLSEATIVGITSIHVNGKLIPLDQASFTPVGGGERVIAAEVTSERNVLLPLNGQINMHLQTEHLDFGDHHLELVFQSKPFGTLKLNVDETLTEEEPPEDHIPRDPNDDYCEKAVSLRQKFLRKHCDQSFEHAFRSSYDPHITQGNIENFIGMAQIPLGIAGPLLVDGEHAQGEFFIPLATTEGTLVASYNRGMKLLKLSGGVKCTVVGDSMQRAPVFVFDDARGGRRFVNWVVSHLDEIREVSEATSNVARLKYIDYYLSNRFAYLRFNYTTGDAAGQNMVGKATFAACNWILENYTQDKIIQFFLESNFATDKKASMINVMRSRGKRVTAEATIPRQVIADVMGADTKVLSYHNGVANVGAWLAGANNNGLHSANAITAMFIATGQDVANVAESSAAVVYTELTEQDDLYFSITLPSLIVATYGGGTGLPTQRECLEMMDCWGKGKVFKFAEIVAATVLAGELSLACAISSLDWVAAHENLGRNR
jgi:hydroxymethylglutaryl-CoA reductase (NADPH)